MKIAPYTERWNEGERDWSYVKDARPGIERWERETGLRLPADYRDFMLRFNGGHVYPRRFHCALAGMPVNPAMPPPSADETYVDLILSWASVERHWRGETYGQGLPPAHLMIAETPGAIQLLMALTAPAHGAVFTWYHSTNIWGTDGNDTVYFQADSFSAFLRSLADDDGSDYASWRLPIYDRLAREFDV